MSEQIIQKFGGSSLANGERFELVSELITESEPIAAVVSAPGARFKGDVKVTDMLEDFASGGHVGIETIMGRFEESAQILGQTAIEAVLKDTRARIIGSSDRDSLVSVGEWFSARLMSENTGLPMVDATNLIIFNQDRSLNSAQTGLKVATILGQSRKTLIIPGFYGKYGNGIATFPRGGSDTTGAILTAFSEATIYENNTDTDGVKPADPKWKLDLSTIGNITYDEMRAFCNVGAGIFQGDSVTHMMDNGKTTIVRNTFNRQSHYTEIADERPTNPNELILAIGSSEDLTYIRVESHGMNERRGEFKKFSDTLAHMGLAVEHMPSGKDSIVAILETSQIEKMNLNNDLVEEILHEQMPGQSYKIGIAGIGAVYLIGQEVHSLSNRSSEIDTRRAKVFQKQGIPILGSDGFNGNMHAYFIPKERVGDAVTALAGEFF